MEKKAIEYDKYSTDELLKMSHEEATEGLSEKQQRFCEAYIGTYSIKSAMIKAGYDYDRNVSFGYTLRKKPAVKKYIQWLKARAMSDALVSGRDIIDQWIRIGFADMTDFVNVGRTSITLKPAEQMDGQLIKSIKSGRDGISIELYDKLKALDSLAKYTADMPKDFRQLIDERRMDLMEAEFELKKRMQDLEHDESEDDGFIEAIRQASTKVWENE